MMDTQNDCGCCDGVSAETPQAITNRPGLSAVAYRTGTRQTFKESLLARLTSLHQPALNAFTSRSDDDFTIALLDAFATMGDVLTFYQERIANEAWLRTATERLSVLQLARLIGYELNPGVAASAYLAFTLDNTPGALGQALSLNPITSTKQLLPPVRIDAATRVQSIPGPGETAQTFETIEPLDAHVEWNSIHPLPAQPQLINGSTSLFIVQGTNTSLKQGNILLVRYQNSSYLKKVQQVVVNDDAKTTWVYCADTGVQPPAFKRPAGLAIGSVTDIPEKTTLSQTVLQTIVSKQWDQAALLALVQTQQWPLDEFVAGMAKLQAAGPAGNGVLYVFRKTAAVFAANAPLQVTPSGNTIQMTEWLRAADENNHTAYLDNVYDEVLAGSFIAVHQPGDAVEQSKVVALKQVDTISRYAYGVGAKTTRLQFNAITPNWWLDIKEKMEAEKALGKEEVVDYKYTHGAAHGKKTTVNDDFSLLRPISFLVQSEVLPLALSPLNDVVANANTPDTALTLDALYLELKKGQVVILAGERSDLKGVVASEVMTIQDALTENGLTVLTFTAALVYSYTRSTVTINANVAAATHGETVQETLGSGNAAARFQRFVLQQPPLTYTGSSSATGAASTLTIRVNDLLWEEVPAFYGHGPTEHIYITRRDDAGATTVIFGDGITGACLPTGQNNIKATYRKGIGLGGLVKANQLSQLLTRPLGVKTVTNPLAAAGAADPEQLEDARQNATLTIRTLNRVVSLQDYQDFARAFAGIAKALATWTWNGQRRCVLLTIAGAAGKEVPAGSQLYDRLRLAILAQSEPHVTLFMQSFKPVYFRITGTVQVNAAYLPDKVLTAVQQALTDNFSFDARNFGDPVAYSEVVSVIQHVEGVDAVDIDAFYRSDSTPDANPPAILFARMPQPGDDGILPAEILILDPAQPADIKQM
ncbi:putative baseplate assembly protein [Deminuibacter soli]|uniref:Putative baseplate assembly protein n=1 Tax=Deminuibacter soli TaxID=2291815 RepID=A0A3E1NG50_9BACT|nr:putative baseplate assembly protein [Deminuibacter soli]RFM26943.1 putative baseplate assembly protein [Deminuibacter soli]